MCPPFPFAYVFEGVVQGSREGYTKVEERVVTLYFSNTGGTAGHALEFWLKGDRDEASSTSLAHTTGFRSILNIFLENSHVALVSRLLCYIFPKEEATG